MSFQIVPPQETDPVTEASKRIQETYDQMLHCIQGSIVTVLHQINLAGSKAYWGRQGVNGKAQLDKFTYWVGVLGAEDPSLVAQFANVADNLVVNSDGSISVK